MKQEFLSIEDVAIYLGIKKSTLYSKVKSGEIPHYRLGHLLKFRKEDIDRWMEGNRQKIVSVPQTTNKKDRHKYNKQSVDVNSIVRKAIDETKEIRYTRHGSQT